MPDVRCDRSDRILRVSMARGKGNALSASLIEALIEAVDEAAWDDEIRGLVLASDVPGFFSTGLDVTEAFRLDRQTMLLFFSRFIDLYEGIYLLPKPVVAAVSGHAYAGGAMLAMTCDVRVSARGKFGFAINEVDLGLTPPPGFLNILVCAVGTGIARELLLSGSAVSPERALDMRIAREVVEPDVAQQRAFEICQELSRRPPGAFAAIKRLLRDSQGRWSSDNEPALLEDFVDRWFSPEAQERKQTLAAKLQAKRV